MSVTGLQPVRMSTETLTEMVFEAIKAAIIDKTIPPGGRVSEASLAAQLNVSKTPVREALLRLRHIGLVEAGSAGLRVVRPSVEATRDAFEYRLGLERISAELAAARAEPAECAAISQAAQASLEDALRGDIEGFRSLDHEFHSRIAEVTGNAYLRTAIENSLVLIASLRVRDVPHSGDSVACGRDHVKIAAAIKDGDGRAAAEAMQHHIRHVMCLVLAAEADASR